MPLKFLKIIPLLCLVLHFSFTALYVMPESILSEYSIILSGKKYIGKYFSQTWTFFAPDPGIYTDKILVGCMNKAKNQMLWLDPTEDLLNKARKSWLFSSFWKLTYIHRNLAVDIFEVTTSFSTMRCHLDSDELKNGFRPCAEAKKDILKTPSFGRALAFGSHACSLSQVGENLGYVKIVPIKKHPFPYSQREESSERLTFKISSVEFDWVKVSS